MGLECHAATKSVSKQTESQGKLQTDVKEIFKKIIPAAGGSFIEWYDFAIYSYVSAYITGNFFSDGHGGSVATWFGFGLTFFFRPLGGAFFGWFADRLGRKPAMQLSIALMLFTTIAQGLLPTFYCCGDSWGWVGMIGLFICRALQGLSAGGEMSIAAAYIAEISPHDTLGFNLSWISVAGNFLSYLVVSLVVVVFQTYFSAEFMQSWGWRLLFLSSLVPGLAVSVGRRYLQETPDFEELLKARIANECSDAESGSLEKKSGSNGIWQELMANHKLALLIGSFGTASIGAVWYVVPTYGVQFIGQYNDLPANATTFSYCICYAVSLLFVPAVGKLIDVCGVGKIFALCAFTGCVVVPIPVFYWWTHVRQELAVSALYVGMAIIGLQGALTCSVYLWVVELFPVKVRTTGVSIAYNIGVGIFGGLGPVFADAANEFISPKGLMSAPVAFTFASGVLSLLALAAGHMLSKRGMLQLTHLRAFPY
eukprot:TRINITY_DN4101_c0_g1_i1.p1 TRINITY_DN4101_c0_g1~~TRINITY_DN4101_c0_g1_i1.p1  ORF type:complete len:482 (+),score=67.73 TRINITY_DN4101_c0_g1_i1:88-1533(+)